jgi:hypothetical protein
MKRKEKYSKENFEKAVKDANSIKSALKNLGLRAAGGNYKVFHKYAEKYNIDTSHFEERGEVYNRTLALKEKIPLSEILVENSNYSRTSLKKRLYDEGLKERRCEMPGCGQGEQWMGKKMGLILDHINGIYNDNRIENLRIICPNCNSTLPTHAGKNNKIKKECIDCRAQVANKSKRCIKCSANKPILKTRKVKRPSYDKLKKEIEELGYSATGRKYGVSDNSIRKWIKSYDKYGKQVL